MIIEKKQLSKLKQFGLNSYESKVWVALLSRGVSTAGELSDIANVPRSRSYDVLESLEKKGFVVMKLGKPIKYIAVPPAEAIDRVKKRIQREAREEESRLTDLKNSHVLEELSELHKQGIETQDPTELTGSIRGRENIYDHLAFQIKSAEESVVLATTKQGIERKTDNLLRYIKKAYRSGVDITIAAPLTPKTKKKLEQYAQLRDTNPESRFCIIDGKKVTIMLTHDEEVHPNYDVAVWMHTPYIAEKLLSTL